VKGLDITIEEITFDEVLALQSAYSAESLNLKNVAGTVWLGAKFNGELIGSCAYLSNKKGIMLKNALVLKQYRGLGIRRRLFAEQLKRIQPLNPNKIYAFGNNNSLPFLLKNGFTPKGPIKRFTYVELNYPFRKEKIDFETFCNVIQGTVVHGPKDVKIFHFANRIDLVRNPCTALFLRYKRKKEIQPHSKQCTPIAIIFEKNHLIDNYLPNVTYIMVENLRKAYWRFVSYYRRMFDIPVFAITGTCGKTTVKEMISHILSCKYNVTSTIKSTNGPSKNLRYLGDITEDTDVAVFETPVDYPGLLEYNCRYFRPTIGMITNIGVDHLRLCGTVENYIQAKGEIIKGLRYKGTLLLNADDEKTKKISLDKYKGKLIYFGIHTPADYQASDIRYVPGGMEFTLHHQHLKHKVFVPGYGEHQVYNALSAIAAVHQMGFGISEAAEQLTSFKNVVSHLEIFTGYNGSMGIDDTWNSNPTSIEACLKVLEKLGANKKKIAVIGSISWLGEKASDIHREVGEMVANYPVDTLIAYGPFANKIAEGAEGMKGEIFACTTVDAIENILLPLLNQDTTLLLKTSMKDKSITTLVSMLKDSSK
jgi:UDP-N-acetylmuramoyl-tripeptide--D-alanyl-D-alanine ligase